jgi:hypothetical protein
MFTFQKCQVYSIALPSKSHILQEVHLPFENLIDPLAVSKSMEEAHIIRWPKFISLTACNVMEIIASTDVTGMTPFFLMSL